MAIDPWRWIRRLRRRSSHAPSTAEGAGAIDEVPQAAQVVAPEGAGGPAPQEVWRIGSLRPTVAADGWTGVEADVDGVPIRVESDGVPLRPRAEAMATALVPSAVAASARIEVGDPVSSDWREGAQRGATLMASWSGAATANPIASGPSARTPVRDRAPGVGLCFTGGVDSFWALLRGGHDPTHLVYVVGYDIALDDDPRIDEQVATVEAVAAATGRTALVVRSDLRAHPHANRVLWGQVHGAALAGVGHLLGEVLGTLVIPPSYADGRLIPWGSRPDLDPLWSLPGEVEVRHSGTPLPRLGRVQAIADEPLVHEHLRVCWEHLGPGANCGRCEKCVRTMVMLAGTGSLGRCRTFPPPEDLPAAIAALAPLPDHHVTMWRDLAELALPAPVHDSVVALLAASPSPSATT